VDCSAVPLLAQGAHLFNSRDSAVGTMTGLHDPKIGFHFPVTARDLSLLRNIQTVYGVHPASC
jgi:hypothetical protein